jgi:hypothetical protein
MAGGHQVTDGWVVRIVVAALAVSAVALMWWRNHQWRQLHRKVQPGWEYDWEYIITRVGVGWTFLAIAWGVVDAGLKGVPVEPRLYWIGVGLFWTTLGLTVTLRRDRKRRRDHAA